MSISRWDPWGELVSLREAMSNLLEESFVRPNAGATSATSALAVDVKESGNAFTVTASVPGVRPEQVEISILGDTLRIHGETKAEEERQSNSGEQTRWLIRERRFGAFDRTITLPTSVKADACTAEFRDGVLTITLPKAEEARARTIPVRGGSYAGQPQQVGTGSEGNNR